MWRNWAGEVTSEPAESLRPGGVTEVAEAIVRAAAAGREVRVAGSGHSFTPLVPTDGTLLSLARMDRVLEADPSSGLVRVEAGITIRALNARLAELGLAMANLGDIDVQSVAGAVATATHGTGSRLGNLSSQVTSVELVDADGRRRVLDGGDELLAGRVALGALGVVTALTLRCVPAFVLRGEDRVAGLEEVLGTLEERAHGHDHFEFYAFPYVPRVLTRTNDRVPGPARPPGRLRRYAEDIALTNGVFAALIGAGKRVPRLVPSINRAMIALAGEHVRVDRSDRIFVSPRLVRFTEMEYAVPRECAAEAVRAALGVVEEGRLPVGFPIEVRFVEGDEALLSPVHGRDSAYVAVHLPRGVDAGRYFGEVEARMLVLGGRPHWGKRHTRTAADLRERYPAWDRFQAVRAALDPGGRFVNAHVREVLGPVGVPDAEPAPV
jgi:L-gulonolactone oxidase